MKRFLAVATPFLVLGLLAGGVATAGPATTVVAPATQSTYLASSEAGSCDNYGGYDVFQVGTAAASYKHGLVEFNLSGIPAGAQIVSATLSLYETITLRGSGTVGIHLVTAPWASGSGSNTCKGAGATWSVTGLGRNWASPGGDVVAQDAASLIKDAGEGPGWDSFDITQIVRGWVDDGVANNGVLVKLDDEAYSPCTTLTNCDYWSYASVNATNSSLRPTLTVVYG